jgi:hypothetical protein
MQEKAIHIVFQVMNYIFGETLTDHLLLPVDRLLLLALAKHHGVKGIYPSTKTLAKELRISKTYVKLRINYLESIKLIRIDRKYGCSHSYFLEFLSTDRATTVDQSSTVDRSTVVTPTGQLQLQDRSTTVDPININNQQRLNNTERRKKAALTLSDDFVPSKQSVKKAEEVGLTEDEANYEFDKFMNHYQEKQVEKTDWQFMLQTWFIRAGDYKRKKGPITVNSQEVKSTVPWYNPADAQRGPAAIGNLLNGLAKQASEHLNKQGIKTNGLGREEEGEGTVN